MIRERFRCANMQVFLTRTRTHIQRWRLAYVIGMAVAIAFPTRFALGLNATPSLPYHLYLIDKHSRPTRGELVAFRWPGGGPYPAGVTFIKRIAGIPGDIVMHVERDFFVNGIAVGTAKRYGRVIPVLELGPTGTLPPAHYYVHAPHPDSLDSRYAMTGWISQDRIIGRAYALF